MKAHPASVDEYIAGLPEDRKEAIQALRQVINTNLNEGFEEGIQYNMIGWYVPHTIFPEGYHCDPKQPLPFMSVASQKSHIGWYAFCLYTEPNLVEWFVEEYKKTGKKLDMGKSCVRFKKLEAIPLELIGEVVKRITVQDFIDSYQSSRSK